MLVDQIIERLALNAKGACRLSDGDPERFKALLPNNAAGMRGAFYLAMFLLS